MDQKPRQPSVELVTAAVAISSIGMLVGLTVLGILQHMPLPAAVAIVVGELIAPLIAYRVMQRRQQK
jgi:hypothetical protein